MERFEENWVKAYALIFDEYCTKAMQTSIEELEDFETAVRNEPLVLLERIKSLIAIPELGLIAGVNPAINSPARIRETLGGNL